MATLDQVIAQMVAADLPPLPPGHPVADGRFHRFGPGKKAWYKLYEFRGRNNRVFIFGSFGVWRGDDAGAFKVESDTQGMDPGELDRIRKTQADAEAKAKQKDIDRARFAAHRAWQQYEAAGRDGESAYLKRKGVDPDAGLRYAQGADGTVLLVPMVRYDVSRDMDSDPAYAGARRLCGLQKIADDGSKLYNKGMAKEGCSLCLGKLPDDGALILIVEGLATGLSVRQATGRAHAVFVAFDAGNLAPVARILRKLYPKSTVLFCADDDAYLEAQLNKQLRSEYGLAALYHAKAGPEQFKNAKGELVGVVGEFNEDDRGVRGLVGAINVGDKTRFFGKSNAGRVKANLAMAEIGNAWVCWPKFKNRGITPDPDKPRVTDFNDLHAAEGLDAVEAQLTAAIKVATSGASKPESTAAESAGAGGKKKRRKDVHADGDGGGGAEDGTAWEKFWMLVNRFTMIYPTDTAFDKVLVEMVKIAHMKFMFGEGYVHMWLNTAKRRSVFLRDVIFEPGGKTEDHQLNLYQGFDLEPSPNGSCRLLLELLQFICGEADQEIAPVTDWVLKWLAYPLQHPGAKMQTAIAMHGEEGSGKNLFFGCVRQIYGQHGGVITQRQLESQFNTWLSAKLFLIANEVVTKQEMTHYVNFLKDLVTGDEVWINKKQKDERLETNHMNMVFLSNELQMLQLGPKDRRYMVIHTPDPLPDERYKAFAAEAKNGGVEALFDHLLKLDLGDFNPHTKPIITQAKKDLIEISMPAPMLYWRDIHDGEIGLPYCPARTEDVYRAFLTWCGRNGEKMPMRVNRFVPAFMSMNGVRRRDPRIGNPARPMEPVRQRRVLMMGAQPADKDEQIWIKEGVEDFYRAVEIYCKGDSA